MMTMNRSRSLHPALLPSLALALGAPAAAFAGAPPDGERTPEAYALVMPDESKFITVNELNALCGDFVGWTSPGDPGDPATPLQKVGFCEAADQTESKALLEHLIATCALRTADPANVGRNKSRATFAELKTVINGECPLAPKASKTRSNLVRSTTGGNGSEGAAAGSGSSFTSDLLWAVTGVVVDRAFETVELWSLNLTLGKMCQAEDVKDEFRVASLTPNTCDLVLTGLSSADATGLGARLKSAATADAITFPRHLVTELLYLQWYEGGEETTPGVTRDLLLSTALGASMIELIVNGQHPIDALAAWARRGEPIKDVTADWTAQPMTTGLYFASFLVANLDPGELKLADSGTLSLKGEMASDPTISALSVTLLYNSTQSLLPDGWLKTLGTDLVPTTSGEVKDDVVLTDLIRLRRVAERLREAGHAVQRAWLVSRSAESGLPIEGGTQNGVTPAQAWRSLATATSGLLEAIVDALDITQPGGPSPGAAPSELVELKKKARQPLTNLSAMLGAIGAGDRTSATLKGIEIGLNLVNGAAAALVKNLQDLERVSKEIKELEAEIATLNKAKPVDATKIAPKQAELAEKVKERTTLLGGDTLKDKLEKLDARLTILRRVVMEAGDSATLVGGLYSAKTVDEMEEVLSAYIAPPGSYVEKRNKPAPRYLSMNGYVGLGGGAEILRIPKTTSDGTVTEVNDPSGAFWPVVALGPEFGWRVCDGCDHPTNFGFFVPLVDLGTLAQYRIESSETTSYPEVALRGVFAPGVYATLGVSKWSSPFAIQAGASLAPALREISVDGEAESRSAVRVGANVVVDVPLRR